MNMTQLCNNSTLQPLKMLVSRYSIQIKNKNMQIPNPEPLFSNVNPEKWSNLQKFNY